VLAFDQFLEAREEVGIVEACRKVPTSFAQEGKVAVQQLDAFDGCGTVVQICLFEYYRHQVV
jgi:hypothetical protein